MDIKPISDLLTDTKIQIRVDDNIYSIKPETLHTTIESEVCSVLNDKITLGETIDKLVELYLSYIMKTGVYKNLIMFLSDETMMIDSITNQIKEQLQKFKYLELLYKFKKGKNIQLVANV